MTGTGERQRYVSRLAGVLLELAVELQSEVGVSAREEGGEPQEGSNEVVEATNSLVMFGWSDGSFVLLDSDSRAEQGNKEMDLWDDSDP